MKTQVNLKIRVILLILTTILFLGFFAGISQEIFSQTVDEIQEEIDKKKEELGKTDKDLKELNNKIDKYESELDSLEDGLPKLEKQIELLSLEIEKNKKEVKQLKAIEELKSLEKQEREANLLNSADSSYKEWRLRHSTPQLLKQEWDSVKVEGYGSKVLGWESGNIDILTGEITDLNKEITGYDKVLKDLDKQNAELIKQKQELEAQIYALNNAYASNQNAVSELLTQRDLITKQINLLSAEQQEAAQKDADRQENSPPKNPNPNLPPPPVEGGQPQPALVRITGKGRDLYQGHGVGMSQWGAHGMASKGWTAKQILEFYYTGAVVSTSSNISNDISIIYCEKNPVFASPSNCGANGPVKTERLNMDKYLAGLGEMPESWPVEARKAQMIAARTYAVRYTNNGDPNKPICLTTSCQVSYVKSGDQNELNIAQATSKQVITHNGQYIEAVYSADNSQGLGTAHNDTIFQNYAGDGTPYSYLRAVNDSAYATPTSWTNWGYQTNQYSIQNIEDMLKYAASSNSANNANLRAHLQSVLSGIGNDLKSIELEKDPSQRVKKVWFVGTNGVKRSVGGYWFKYIWNGWAYDKGIYDYIYSQSFAIN
jgi:SpoIID/LytB domain protein